jgi:hypothetical protein
MMQVKCLSGINSHPFRKVVFEESLTKKISNLYTVGCISNVPAQGLNDNVLEVSESREQLPALVFQIPASAEAWRPSGWSI